MDDALKDNYSAKQAYARGFATEPIRLLFLNERQSGWKPERCGGSGFRVCRLEDSRHTVKLAGAETTLTTLCWSPTKIMTYRAPTRKRGRYEGEASSYHHDSTVRFEDGRVYFGRGGGRLRGADVHTQIEHYVKWAPPRFTSLYPQGVDPMSKAALVCLFNRKLHPIDTERIVYNLEWRLGTAIDLPCVMGPTGNELALVEVKTGGANGSFTALIDPREPNMKAPFDGIPDTPLNRARLQILLGKILFERSYPMRVAACFVLHAPSSEEPAVLIDVGPVAQYEQVLIAAIIQWRCPDSTSQTTLSLDFSSHFFHTLWSPTPNGGTPPIFY
jgi:hypothetical protein